MLISSEWLSEYITIDDLSPNQIAETLTQLGLEVESIEKPEAIDQLVVVGRITECKAHPDAEKLQICSVDIGAKENLTIVCGASNARKDICVAVAQIGAKLPGDFKIKSSKIRNIASFGMLCSEKELNLSDEHEGIWEIPGKEDLGTPIQQLVKTEKYTIDISITPNRADCLSYIGVARDLAAKLKRPLKLPTQTKIECKTDHVPFSLKVENLDDCARFVALKIKNIGSSTSPSWVKQRLQDSGMRSVNLIVDLTNYALLEWGQPIHAYDAKKLQGKTLEVRSAHIEDKLKTLDGEDAKIIAGDLLVCDEKNAVAIAGVMGGQNSEVDEKTTEIIVEVAHFSPSKIRKTSKRLALHTEASQRFERGIDIEAIDQVALRVFSLLNNCLKEQEKEPAEAEFLLDNYPQHFKKQKIALRLPRLKMISGLSSPTVESCTQQLESLGINLIDKTKERMLFEVPSHRNDIKREIDLIEEVLRLEGYDKVPYTLPKMDVGPNPENPFIEFCDQVKTSLATQGLNEVMTFPFLSEEHFSKLGLTNKHFLWPSIKLSNALNDEMAFMQSSLVPGLLQALLRNRHHGKKGSRLFELGRAYFEKSKIAESSDLYSSYGMNSEHLTNKAKSEANRPVEVPLLTAILDQTWQQKSWNKEEQITDFFHAKTLLENLVRQLGAEQLKFTSDERIAEQIPFLHPGLSALVTTDSGKIIAYAGELHPQLALSHNLGDEIPVIFELNLEVLFEFCQKKRKINSNIQRFPAIRRDLALAVPEQTTFAELEKSSKSFPQRKHLKDITLFDLYSSDKMQEGKKSMAASFTFQSLEKTLTDKEVDKEIKLLLQWLETKLSAEQR